MIAIGGTGMAPLASLLQRAGHRVRGSDRPLYPPMSELLAEVGIEPLVGPDPAHLEPRPDLVIVGNAVPRDHPEALAVEALGVERISMPQAVARFFLEGRRPLVVAGTHGKTTTSAMAAWTWSRLGQAPGYLIGGMPIDLDSSFEIGSGERFILEGDEYNAAYFDRGPKFLHYRPESAILTSVEYDHADLYPDLASLERAFAEFTALIPETGTLAAHGGSAAVRRAAAAARCSVRYYGFAGDDLALRIEKVQASESGTRIWARDRELGSIELELSVWGRHNVLNAAAVWCITRADGLEPEAVAEALRSFRGVRRRLEVRGRVGGVTVIDDFAHHPTEVRCSLEALRMRYPDSQLVCLFEPRSLTAGRSFLFDAYVEAFAGADRVLLAPIFHEKRLDESERLDRPALARELEGRGVELTPYDDVEELLADAVAKAAPGEVLVTMSSGSFADLPRRLLAGLAERLDS